MNSKNPCANASIPNNSIRPLRKSFALCTLPGLATPLASGICLALLILAAASTGSCQQGGVVFRNDVPFQTPDPTGGNRLVYLDVVGGTKLVGTQYLAELYYGTDAGSLQPLPSAVGHFRLPSTGLPGTWIYAPGAALLPEISIAGQVTLQVRVWDGSQFASYEQALGQGLTGASAPVFYTIPPSCLPNEAACYMEGLRAFALVPEPTALVLSFIGLTSVLLVRKIRHL